MSSDRTDSKILAAAQALLTEGGFGGVSFDKIANTLGITKQSVLYWFPTKHDLLAAMFCGWLGDEADAAEVSLRDATSPDEATAAFVRAIVAFHASNLDRYRMMYLAPQTMKSGVKDARKREVLVKINATTARLYGALAVHLDGSEAQARQSAFAIHAAVLGLLLMLGLADGVGDPLKHGQEDLVNALIHRLTSQS